VARRRRPAVEVDDPAGIPAELLDPHAAVWHDRQAHERYMAAHGWYLGVRDRLGGPGEPPGSRRAAAMEGWAVDNGITTEPFGAFADWNRISAMGLID
jgi:hypothetical protein